jgi:branched-chain amino acid transport system substrate-binding protein
MRRRGFTVNARRVASIAAASAIVATAVGCGSDSLDTDNTGTSGTTPASTSNGAAASGDSVVIGLIVQTNNDLQSVPEAIATAQAATGWVNDEQGGINGRKLQLEICESSMTGSSVVACANKLIQKRAVAVVSGGDIGMVAGMPVFTSAKVPVIGGAWARPEEVLGPEPIYRSAMVGFGLSLGPAIAHYAHERHDAKKIVLVSQEPSRAIVEPLLSAPSKKLGGPPVDFVGAPPTAPDLAPYFVQAASHDPDVIAVFGLPCLPVLQAFKASGSDAALMQPAQCADAKTLEAAGDLADGSLYIYGQPVPALNPDNPDVQVFESAMDTYAPDTPNATSDFGTSVFQGVMNVADLAREMPEGEVTPAGLQKLVRATRHQKNWLGLSGFYSCNPPPVAAYPAICSVEAQLAQMRDGKLELAEPGFVDLAPTLE